MPGGVRHHRLEHGAVAHMQVPVVRFADGDARGHGYLPGSVLARAIPKAKLLPFSTQRTDRIRSGAIAWRKRHRPNSARSSPTPWRISRPGGWRRPKARIVRRWRLFPAI